MVIETEREWEFITEVIQTRKGAISDEWLIGLLRSLKTGKWTWINGKPLTIDKWETKKHENNDHYALIAKEGPDGRKGSFNSITGAISRGWICEEETGIHTAERVCSTQAKTRGDVSLFTIVLDPLHQTLTNNPYILGLHRPFGPTSQNAAHLQSQVNGHLGAQLPNG